MRILIAAGGTGGHINPGLAMARLLQQAHPEAEIRFVGTERGLEATLVPREGFSLMTLDVRGFRRRLSLDTLKSVGALFRSLFQTSRMLREWRPDLVIGTGGYVCGPVMGIAALRGIPTLLHESNALPGVTTRLLALSMSRIAVNFEDSVTRLPKKARVRVTGNPIRQSLLEAKREVAREKLGLERNEPFVVISFGSLGASTLNRVMGELLRANPGGFGFRLLYGTGMKHHEALLEAIDGKIPPGVEVRPYLYEMDELLAAADVGVFRAGAMFSSEICARGLPSILIPSPYVADNHQEYNARALEARGAAVVVLEQHLSGDILLGQIKTLLADQGMRRRMSVAALKAGRRDGGEALLAMAEELLRKGGVG